ncbi:MAG: hypothetical protein B6U89_06320 [Desulfurococcales archaeon ex4484_58]|nr:MAG: hypothetical protein B6U89_06320 [Desulfurococcales archaeon ex4484_58]
MVSYSLRKGLENLSEPYKTLVHKLVEALREVFGENLVSIIIYGSVARDEARRDSDLDLLIIARNLPRSRGSRVRLFEKAEEQISSFLDELFDQGYYVSLSPIILTPEEARKIPPIMLDMVIDSIIVYDKQGFIENLLKYLAEKLEELGAERINIGKKWYWRLKKNYRLGEEIVIE